MTSRENTPIALDEALASFDALWSPRIVTRVNDYDVRVAKVEGDHVWHVHDDTDEFFLVVDGELTIALREPHGRARCRPAPGLGLHGSARDVAQAALPEGCLDPSPGAHRNPHGRGPPRRRP